MVVHEKTIILNAPEAQIANDLNESQHQIKELQKRIMSKTGTRNLSNAREELAKNGFVFTE